jgi:uncharacterized membrane protein YedE/YeeE
MKLFLSIFIAGLFFGMGLAISGMTDPARVAGFLDITGEWDITLIFVMGSALLVTLPGFYLVQKRARPWYAGRFNLPTKMDIDWKLIAGAILFGVGWGISGFCPGPAIASLVTGSQEVVYFVLAMILGQNLSRWFEKLIDTRKLGSDKTT